MVYIEASNEKEARDQVKLRLGESIDFIELIKPPNTRDTWLIDPLLFF